MRRDVAIAVVVVLAGLALILAGSAAGGAAVLAIGVAGAIMAPWLRLLFAAAREGRRHRPPRDATVRNSEFGFVRGLWRSTNRGDSHR